MDNDLGKIKNSTFYKNTTYLLQVVLAIGDYMSIQCHACIGGTNVGEDMRKLDYGQHVISGTPGRVFGWLLLYVLNLDIKHYHFLPIFLKFLILFVV